MTIIIVSHGSFAQAMLETAQMIVGEIKDVYAFGIIPGEELELFEAKIEKVLKKAEQEKQDVFVFSDIFFGTPFNTVIRLMGKYDIYHYAGISMPLLLECLTGKDSMSAEELKTHIEEANRKSFVNVNEFIENCKE